MSDIQTNVVKPSVIFTENDIDYRNISEEFEVNLDSKYLAILDFTKNNDGKGKTDLEKDNLYKDAQQLWADYTNALKSTKYNFNLNRTQWKYLSDLIQGKLEYDINTVFIAIELTEVLGTMREDSKIFNNDNDSFAFLVNATEITYIYHLIAEHKVKGLTKDTYTFSEILKRIGAVSKVFNYYDTIGKNLAADIQDWVACFDENVTMEQPKSTQTEIDFEEVKF
jgi:hypothetical protein